MTPIIRTRYTWALWSLCIKMYLPVEFQSFMFTVQSRSLCSHLTVLHADPVFLPGPEAQHPQTKRPPLRGLYQRCCRLVLPDGDAVDLHDVIPGPQPSAAGWRARRAVLYQQGAVSYNGEAKTAIWAWYDVHL